MANLDSEFETDLKELKRAAEPPQRPYVLAFDGAASRGW
eukprot:gene3523-20028_t